MSAPALFDADYYVAQLPEHDRDHAAAAAWQHYVANGANYDPSPYFSASFYRAMYGQEPCPLLDFLEHLEAGDERQTHPLFDAGFYRANLPELPADVPAIVHFERHGDIEGRSPSADFDADFYRKCYMPLQATRPLRHYTTRGRALGYLPHPIIPSAEQIAQRCRDVGPVDLIMIAHDAQRAGGPMLLLATLKAMRADGVRVLVVMINAGPMLEEYRAQAPVIILNEGWPLEAVLDHFPAVPVLSNTVVSLPDAITAHDRGHEVLALIHELPQSIKQWGLQDACQDAQSRGIQFGVSTEQVRDWVDTLLPRPLTDQATILGAGSYAPAPVPSEVSTIRARMATDGAVFVSAGHADHRKGFDLFLETAREIYRELPTSRFVWIGPLDPWAQDLAATAQREGLPLILPGDVANPASWFGAADVYLLTSRAETGPATLQEALLAGCPTVGFLDCIGLENTLVEYGHAVPAHDTDALAKAAMEITGTRVPEKAIAELRKRFDFDAYVTRLRDALGLGA